MRFIIYLGISILLVVGCIFNKSYKTPIKVVADSLVVNIEKYRNSKVEVEGIIAHVCGVDGKKMKLRTERGRIIKIIPKDSTTRFTRTFNKKKIKIIGVAEENRINIATISKRERDKAILCHIDNKACTDTAWINRKRKAGVADKISKAGVERLRQRMKQSGKDYVSVVILRAEKIEVIK